MKKISIVILSLLAMSCTNTILVEDVDIQLKACKDHGGASRILVRVLTDHSVKCKDGTVITPISK